MTKKTTNLFDFKLLGRLLKYVLKYKVTFIFVAIAAVLIFALDGKILWMVGLWMVLGSIVGAWLSSRWSVKKGDKVIRITLLIMVSYMAVKLWMDTFSS